MTSNHNPSDTLPDNRALIIMAHGSRRDSANTEFFELVKNIDQQSRSYGCIRPALLEQAPPTLLQAAEELPASITAIDVYPLFFNCGRHVEKDIPQQVSELIERYPSKTIRLLDYFGQSEQLAGLILNHVAQQQ
ncbi:MAG: sirohydrochlorin chelatase [Cellvibrionaceae bacterium]